MAIRKTANKNHPDYQEYIKKCYSLRDKYQPVLDAIDKACMEKFPDWRGLDCPWDDEIRPIQRQYHDALKKLQNEYSYLFTVEVETDD